MGFFILIFTKVALLKLENTAKCLIIAQVLVAMLGRLSEFQIRVESTTSKLGRRLEDGSAGCAAALSGRRKPE